jgi:hypothetical protein
MDQTAVECNTINFYSEVQETPILKLCANGDIFVKGKLIENDKELVDALREFITKQQKNETT